MNAIARKYRRLLSDPAWPSSQEAARRAIWALVKALEKEQGGRAFEGDSTEGEQG